MIKDKKENEIFCEGDTRFIFKGLKWKFFIFLGTKNWFNRFKNVYIFLPLQIYCSLRSILNDPI